MVVGSRVVGQQVLRALAVLGGAALALSLLPGAAMGQETPGAERAQQDGDVGAPMEGCPVDPPAEDFSDRDAIPDAHLQNVDCAASFDIVLGFEDGDFRPSLTVRRDQMASFIHRTLVAADVDLPPASEGEDFADVDADNPHRDAIRSLEAAGIVQGGPLDRPASEYGPTLSTRRDQMTSLIVRGGEFSYDQDFENSAQQFDDVPSGNVHFENVNFAAENGIVLGFDEDTFGPGRHTRRDQMASFVVRLLNFLTTPADVEITEQSAETAGLGESITATATVFSQFRDEAGDDARVGEGHDVRFRAEHEDEPGVVVPAETETVQTDEDGEASFSFTSAQTGTVTVTASIEGPNANFAHGDGDSDSAEKEFELVEAAEGQYTGDVVSSTYDGDADEGSLVVDGEWLNPDHPMPVSHLFFFDSSDGFRLCPDNQPGDAFDEGAQLDCQTVTASQFDAEADPGEGVDVDYGNSTFWLYAGEAPGNGDRETGAFSGQVTDEDEQPVEDTLITFDVGGDEFTATTDANGDYLVEGVEPGTYDVTATAEDFGSDTAEGVEIQADEVTEGVGFTLAALVACGDEVTEDVTLTRDLGPCPTEGVGPLAGLTVTADDVTVDLNGHTITGDPEQRPDLEMGTGMLGSKDQPAIRLDGVSGVTVQNGTVEHFDAGVEIMRGSDNTIRNVTARDNVNYRVVTGEEADPGTATPVCRLGEGISVFNSTDNVIEDNTIESNGPLAGITLKGTWPTTTGPDRNVVRGNDVLDNDVANLTPDGRRTVCGTGELAGTMTRGPAIQTIGISVEGPTAEDNSVQENTVARSAVAGIGLHGHECEVEAANTANLVAQNMVSETGLTTHEDEPVADGIAVLERGDPETRCVAHNNTIQDNTSTGNFRDGIFMGGRGSHSNVVDGNTVDENDRHGLAVSGPADDLPGSVNNTLDGNSGDGNTEFDGADFNPECDENEWQNSDFGTVNQACVDPDATVAGDATR